MLAPYMLVLQPCVCVCPSVCHKSEFYSKTAKRIQLVFGMEASFHGGSSTRPTIVMYDRSHHPPPAWIRHWLPVPRIGRGGGVTIVGKLGAGETYNSHT